MKSSRKIALAPVRTRMVKAILLSILTIFFAVSALFASTSSFTPPLPPDFTPEPRGPFSLNELLSRASLIVIGTVGPVQGHLDFAVYGYDGELMTARPVTRWGSPMGDVYATDFVIYVDDVLRDDGTIASGAPVILREPARLSEVETAKLRGVENFEQMGSIFSWTGDRNLFLLSPVPDNSAYGYFYWEKSKLSLDGDRVLMTNGAQSSLEINGAAITLAELREAIGNPEAMYDGSLAPVQSIADAAPLYLVVPPGTNAPDSPLATPEPSVWPSPIDRYMTPSLPQLLTFSSLIVRGEIGSVQQYVAHAVYGEDGQLIEDIAPGTLPAPATDFVIQVDRVYRDDGRIADEKPVILRMPGHITEELVSDVRNSPYYESLEYPPVFTGDKGIFLLTPNPDGETYELLAGPYSRLIEDRGWLRRSNGAEDLLLLAGEEGPVSRSTFIRAVNNPKYGFWPGIVPSISGTAVAPPTREELIAEHMGVYFMSRAEAEARVDWLNDGGQRWIDEFNVLITRLRNEDDNYTNSWIAISPPYTFHVVLKDPDAEAFANEYLQNYEWAENVIVEGVNE